MYEIDGIPVVEIRPTDDAGTIKTGVSERIIPIHNALLQGGFLSFVKARKGKPLFYGRSSGDPEKLHGSKGVSNKLRDWIRDLGFKDPRKKPSHAIRSWFKSAAMDAGMTDRMVDAIQGHAPRSEGDGYFTPPVHQMLAALEKLELPPKPRLSDRAGGVDIVTVL
ncbi:MAG: hypothetical protein QM744_02750 [Mesorhizobium sp.]